MEESKKFEEGTHYYFDGKRVVFTALYHLERGYCCGSNCRHCPYEPRYEKGGEKISEEFVNIKNQ
jgi:biotin synthase-like enzyme